MLEDPPTADYRTAPFPLDGHVHCVALPIRISESGLGIASLDRNQEELAQGLGVRRGHSQGGGEDARLVLPLVVQRIETVVPQFGESDLRSFSVWNWHGPPPPYPAPATIARSKAMLSRCPVNRAVTLPRIG